MMAGSALEISKIFRDLPSFNLSGSKDIDYYPLSRLEDHGIGVSSLPFSIRIMLESMIRNYDGKEVKTEDVLALAYWNPASPSKVEIPFKISRVLMQDFTGVPAVVDLAAMRDYVVRKGGSPEAIQPIIPTDLIIDHSVQVDAFNSAGALEKNQEFEIRRNKERYNFLKWGGQAFNNFRVFPPSAGICHQVNLEYLATCVTLSRRGSGYLAFPDTLVGTDSHTTMINGLGVLGFGVGGIEAEAALLGQAISLPTPRVLGVQLDGSLRDGVTATDFALTLTAKLRERGVVNMFVEFFGKGLKGLSLPERATLSNMCPEYGATVAIFPVDEKTIKYLEMTGRSAEQVELVRKYYSSQKMFAMDFRKVRYSSIMRVDLGEIEPSISGPSLPKQQMAVGRIRQNFIDSFMGNHSAEVPRGEVASLAERTRWASESAATAEHKPNPEDARKEPRPSIIWRGDSGREALKDGDVVIASITSCTNTSNPLVMICAGLLARNALRKDLSVNRSRVKTSMGPGSRVVIRYLEKAGLMRDLERLGFGAVGFGCITCIGNSGPLIGEQSRIIKKNNLAVAAVLSGNRNYEARIHPDVRANYLMSPPLVLAFAIAGTVLKDLDKEPLGTDGSGKPVYLRDIWPAQTEIEEVATSSVERGMFEKEYGPGIFEVNPYWNGLKAPSGREYKWS